MHLCAQLTAAFWTLEPFGEIGANFSLQLSSRPRFDEINKKRVIAENQCEKHKKSSLGSLIIVNSMGESFQDLEADFPGIYSFSFDTSKSFVSYLLKYLRKFT